MSIHHDILGHCLVAVDSQIVENEEVAIWSPTKLRQRVDDLLLLVDGYFVYQVELFVELDQRFVVGGKIEVLLRGREGGRSDAVFVLGFNVHFTSLLNSEYAALPVHYQNFLVFDKLLKQQYCVALQLLDVSCGVYMVEVVIFGVE
jgi:hypothetical protein